MDSLRALRMKLAVVRIRPDGQRERTAAFTRLVSHFVFQDRYGRARGNDKGKVEALVKFARRTFLTPVPSACCFADLKAEARTSLVCCRKRGAANRSPPARPGLPTRNRPRLVDRRFSWPGFSWSAAFRQSLGRRVHRRNRRPRYKARPSQGYR